MWQVQLMEDDSAVDCEASIITPELLEKERAIFKGVFNSPSNRYALENTDIVKRHSSKWRVC